MEIKINEVTIEEMGMLSHAQLVQEYNFSNNLTIESYITLMSKISALSHQIKQVVLFSYAVHEQFYKMVESLKEDINNFISSHEKIYANNKKEMLGKAN